MDTKTIIIIILIPIISAFLGWITNYIAIKSLFRPLKKTKFLFFTFWGIIPKRQKKLSHKISIIVEEYFLSHDDLIKMLDTPENIKKIKSKIQPIIENKFISKIPEMFKPMAMPIISKIVSEELDGIILKLNNEIGSVIEESVDIKKIVYEKLINYDVSNLEKIIYGIAKSELKHIEYLGAVIGFIVGLFQVILFLLL